jgi:hypothetical protein
MTFNSDIFFYSCVFKVQRTKQALKNEDYFKEI